MQNKLVSVIIPIYNVEKYVEKAIRSIQNQTYQNLEIIIVDDGSRDSTFSIVQKLSKQDKRIKLYKNEQNQKIAQTLNRAFSLSSGVYIARMDGDDISALDRIEKKVKFLEKNQDIDLVGCSMKAIDVHGNAIGQNIHYANEKLLLKTIKYVTPVSHIWVARRSLYDKLNAYRDMPGIEDYDFLLRMTSNGFRYTNLENYFGYSVRLGRVGNTISRFGVKQMKMHAYVNKLYRERLKHNGKDTFSQENFEKSIKANKVLERLHSLSAMFVYKAIELKANKQYFKTSAYLVLSLISPYQIVYLYKRVKYRLIVKGFKK